MAISTAPHHQHHQWAFMIGLLGNIISVMVYLAPLPTFYRVYKKKSTEGFQSIPYVVALFSAMLWIYYAFLKSDDAFLLITINSIGCIIETIYISIFITYAPKTARVLTAKLLVLMNFGLFSLILLLTLLLAKGSNRVRILGWVCVAFSACVFAAPLSIMRLVIRTKSVEFMPFSLSFFLTLSAILWFSYGFLLKDLYVALPNVLGFIFGVLQMGLYAIYKDGTKVVTEEDNKLPVDHCQHNTTTVDVDVDVIKLSTMGSTGEGMGI
ncbi:SWEET sugar transporter [Macleaya cordata]|uniref:Bidirectional sugar transporter SWEET n=1 Tax=Macleaya cordata TaxID=56857 RepID=A0A200R3Y3_MACCD|nr:SWEET sugar transporter [Macleaya cordata]